MKKTVIALSASVAVVLVAVTAACLFVQPVRWRAQAIWLTITGQVADLSTREVLRMVRPGSGYWLEDLVENHSAYATISNPFVAPDDVSHGQKLFLQNCSGCHGADARGRETAPSLIGRVLTHGDSDWAMYRTVLRGIPGTSMPAHDLDHRQVWQMLAYVRSVGKATAAADGGTVQPLNVNVPFAELAALREPGADWLSYSGSYYGTRHSSLTQITRDNVKRLAPRWIYQYKPGDRVQTNPIVRNGVMFVTQSGRAIALNATTGKQLWEFNRPEPADSVTCCNHTNRGIALLDDRVFLGTIDAKLIALSANTGKKLWEASVAPDYAAGYSINGAPLAFKNLVVTGVAGGDYPNRGFIAAYDTATGKEQWRFETIPGEGKPGHETWPNTDAWKQGGGATWVTGSYDPTRDLVIWGVANPAPNHNASRRRGDNLYTDSVVALRASTGELAWHFQFTPNDDHDWDSAQTPVILEQQLLWANRNAFFYSLDMDTGRFMYGAPYVHQTWAKGLDARGRPIRNPDVAPTPKGTVVYPSVTGATNWWPASYDPEAGLMIVPSLEYGGIYFSLEDYAAKRGELYLAGGNAGAPGASHYRGVTAIRAATGEVVWRHRQPASTSNDLHLGGLVSTRGGVVFASDDQDFYALDTKTGNVLWSFKSGGRIAASPITYSVDNVQYVAISAGFNLLVFALVDQ
jgi:alcohol dehydrogenase (cytochrome c)